MSEFATIQPKQVPARNPAADHALAEVEKWMAIIREINPKPREAGAEASKALAAAGDGSFL